MTDGGLEHDGELQHGVGVLAAGPAAALTEWAGLDAAGIAAAVVASLTAAEQTVS
ncbi:MULTISPECIES: hypothetical protein [unclassified Frankia]|uniref:hypothetical protein n=1 Tax=unclassified Frankia TaxID=2632575 RepID=UPI002AD25534|nr:MULTISPECIES: hypothetical protein [unclassified Frankia]